MKALSMARLGADKRGAPRLWLEGRNLQRAGFHPATRYSIVIDEAAQKIELRIVSDGDRMVSRKAKGQDEIPVIDLASRRLLDRFHGLETVRVRFDEGAVVITPTAVDIRRLERIARLNAQLKGATPLSTGSISTGLGVLAHAIHTGLNKAGIESHLDFAVDIEPAYLEQAAAANPVWCKDTIAVDAPLQALAFDPDGLSRLPQVSLLEVGIPCTAHSNAGRAKKHLVIPEDDPNAGHLAVGFLAIVAATNPAVLLVENVPGYMTSASFAIIRNQLDEWGYEVQADVLRGEDFGSLEHRNRMALVAVTKGVPFSLASLQRDQAEPCRLGDVLDDIPEDSPMWSEMTYLRDKEVRDAEAGKGFRMQVFTAESERVSTIGRGYQKNRSTEPKLQHPTDPRLLRLLTPAEHARIKGVPEQFVEGVSATRAHEMLGQSIIAHPFRALGQHIGQSLIAYRDGVALPQVAHSAPRVAQIAAYDDLPLFSDLLAA